MPEVVSIEHDDDLDDDFGDPGDPQQRPVGIIVAIAVVGVLLAIIVFFLFSRGGGDEPTTDDETETTGVVLDATDPRAQAVSGAVDGWAQFVNAGGDMTGLDAFFDPDGPRYEYFETDPTQAPKLIAAGPLTNPYSVTTSQFVLVDDDESKPVVEATSVWDGPLEDGSVGERTFRLRYELRGSTVGAGWRVWSVDTADGEALPAVPATFCEAAEVASELPDNDAAAKEINDAKEGDDRIAVYLEVTRTRLAAFQGMAATAPPDAATSIEQVVDGLRAQEEILLSGKSASDIDKAMSSSAEMKNINPGAKATSTVTQRECGVEVAFD